MGTAKRILLALILTGLSSQAEGAVITVQSNLTTNSLMSGSTGGLFDVDSYLSGQTLLGATLNFLFQDDGDLTYSGSSFNGWYAYSGSDPNYYGYQNYNYYDASEAATLATGSQGSTGTSAPYSYSSYAGSSTSYYTWEYGCSWWGGCSYDTDYYTTFYYYNYSGYTGTFGVSFSLNAAGLATLASTGELPFTLSMNGDAYLRQHNLTLNLEPAPALGPVASPEPGSMLLLATGLVAAGVRRRRQRRT